MSQTLSGILAVMLCALVPLQAVTDTTRDHYKFWRVTPVPFVTTVKLLGQFDADVWWDAKVGSVRFLANPTLKKHRATTVTISRRELHMVAYSLTPAITQPAHEVVIQNQFTLRTPGRSTETWAIGAPELLLLPAGKAFASWLVQTPARADHFVCYAVSSAAPFAVTVTLQDQFDARSGTSEEITTLEPAYFCVPVQKADAQHNVHPIIDGNTHLALYKILPSEKAQFDVRTSDQFGRRSLKTVESAMLGVPSGKIEWKVLLDTSGERHATSLASPTGGPATGTAELCGADGYCNRGACGGGAWDPDCEETEVVPSRLSDITGCNSDVANEIALAIEWGATNWDAYEAALDRLPGVNVGSCLETLFKTTGKVSCEARATGSCKKKGTNSRTSPFGKTVRLCPAFVTLVRGTAGVENRQACYFAAVTHEWAHNCWRTHDTVELMDDEAFNFWKASHPNVTIDYSDCNGG